MENNKHFLMVQSRASQTALDKFGEGPPADISENSVGLFLDYSPFEIPLGERFDTFFWKVNFDETLSIACEIVAVTQQFSIQLSAIPERWKSLCFLRFQDEFPPFVAELPESDGWDFPTCGFICNQVHLLEIQDYLDQSEREFLELKALIDQTRKANE